MFIENKYTTFTIFDKSVTIFIYNKYTVIRLNKLAKYIKSSQEKSTNINKTLYNNSEQVTHMVNGLEEQNQSSIHWIFNYRLGYVPIYIEKNDRLRQYYIKHKESMEDDIPIHPLIGFQGLNNLFIGNFHDPNKAEVEGWKSITQLAIEGKANISLLKGITIQDPHNKYTMYARRDHELQAAPGFNSEAIKIEQFNFIEVS